MTASVYLLVAEAGDVFKIGLSVDAERRASEVALRPCARRSVRFSLPACDAAKAERALHYLFRAHRRPQPDGDGRTEWFDTAALDEVIRFMTENRSLIGWTEFSGFDRTHAPVRRGPHVDTPWQARLKAAGLTQKRLARWLGVSENTISRQMKGEWPVAGYVLAAVAAWEVMDEPTREAWLRRIEEG